MNYKEGIFLTSLDRILLDFKSAAINAFRSDFPYATVTVRHFHLTQSIVGEISVEAYAKNLSLRLAIRCTPALAMISSCQITDVF